jgi:hypothetical protein
VLGGTRDRTNDLGVGVAKQHRAPGADQVDELVAVDVIEVRTRGARDEARRAADGQERADR